MQTISLCMITYNEEANIGRCLKSVAGVVDEIIVVDTGSSDCTVKIAATFGAKVINYVWNNDFSAARNESLKYATGDWILFLDADEELAPDSREILRSYININNEVEGYFIKIVNFLGNSSWTEPCSDLVFRLFKNKKEYEFHGAIHEQIVDVILKVNPNAKYTAAEDIVINHYGYLDQEIAAKNKKTRNLSIIENEILQEPNNRMLKYHYGVELYRTGRYEEAVQQFISAANGIDAQTVYLPKLLRYIVMSYYAAKDYSSALGIIETALGLFPNYADLFFYAGLIHYEQQNYGLSYDYFNKAITFRDQPVYYASFSGLNGFRAYYYLGQIAEKFCNEEEAMRYYILCIRDNAQFLPALDKICQLLKPWKDIEESKNALEKIFDLSDSYSCLAIAGALFRQNAYRLALEYLERYQTMNLLTEEQQIWKMICLIQQRRFFEALKIIEQFDQQNANYGLCQFNRLICFWLQGSLHKVFDIAGNLASLGLATDTAAVIGIIVNVLKPVRKANKFCMSDFTLLQDLLVRFLDLGEIDKVKAMTELLDDKTIVSFAETLGKIFLKYDYLELAEYYLCLALEREPSIEAVLELGEIYITKEMFFEAEYYYRLAIGMNGKNPQGYVKLLRLYDVMRFNILRQAVEQHPDIETFAAMLKEAENTLCQV